MEKHTSVGSESMGVGDKTAVISQVSGSVPWWHLVDVIMVRWLCKKQAAHTYSL